MATLEVKFEVFCVCGNALSANILKGGDLKVEACQKCIDVAWDEAHSEGYKKCEKDNNL